MAGAALEPLEEIRARVTLRRIEELDTARFMVRVLEDIPRALEYCLRFKADSAEILKTECENRYDDWGVAEMAHWPIIGPVVEIKAGPLKRFRDKGPKLRTLHFWLRTDGEIVTSWSSIEYSRERFFALTEIYDLKKLKSDQLADLLRGIHSI